MGALQLLETFAFLSLRSRKCKGTNNYHKSALCPISDVNQRTEYISSITGVNTEWGRYTCKADELCL